MMTIVTVILLVFFAIYFLSLLLLLINFPSKETVSFNSHHDWPVVSVLVAARNEEAVIKDCLLALAALDYPELKLEVLIGNDQSEDNTAQIVLDFIEGRKNFRLINIKEATGSVRGKANVLAQLAREAKGNYFFITDADIKVPPSWVKSILQSFRPDCGIVSGVTIADGGTFFAKFQALDWLFAFGMVKVASDLNIPVTAVGNNMAISRKAYESTGGYEKIPFSVTEDFQLFVETLKKGWSYRNLLDKDVLAVTAPVSTFKGLLSQRKRWMQGAVKLPFILVLFLTLQALFFSAVAALIVFSPLAGAAIWAIKILLQHVFIRLTSGRVSFSINQWKYFLPYEIYSGLLSVSLLIFFLLPGPVKWKGRNFN